MARVTRQSDRRGVTTVEAALVFPLLLMLTFALIEYGWMFIKAQQVINTARHGVRTAVTPDATNDQVLTAISNFMAAAEMGESGYVVRFSPGDVSASGPGDNVTVEVEVPYQQLNLMNVPFIPLPGSLRASVSMAKEGP